MCKGTRLLALMISICTLCACSRSYLSDRDMDIYEKIHRYYSEMESYSATVHITAYSNKTKHSYVAEQKVLGQDKCYTKISSEQEDLTVTTIENNGKVKTTTQGSNYSVTVPSHEGTGLLFINRFFAKYYASENTSLSVNGGTKGTATILETELSEDNPYFAQAKLSIDNKTLAPIRLEITDMGGKTVLEGEFTDFRYNDTIDEDMFSTEEGKD